MNIQTTSFRAEINRTGDFLKLPSLECMNKVPAKRTDIVSTCLKADRL